MTPVKDGGIPTYAELKLVFKEGGAFEFYNAYIALLDRVHEQEDGAPVDHLEDLPVYTNEPTSSGSVGQPVPEIRVENESTPEQLNDDLPPAYDEVASDEGERGRSRVRH